MAVNYGYEIANYDKKIQNILRENAISETNSINRYKGLKTITTRASESYNKDFQEILEDHRLELVNKLQVKERQYEALLNLLTYLNALTLEIKNKSKSHIKEIVNKITILEKQISKLRNII
jgi:hypothetical protein